ncbi:MAG: TlpA family protein disulfide reductase [Pseudomonadota bacterium]
MAADDLADAAPTAALQPFELRAGTGSARRFSGRGPALVAFVKEDCPTCKLVMPILAALTALASRADLAAHLVGQTVAGNRQLEASFPDAESFEVLDDATLAVSYGSRIETVPTLMLATETGEPETLIGFVREDWQAAISRWIGALELPPFDWAWSDLPEWRPGCGSLSVDPAHADRLRAEAEGSPLRARRVTVGTADDPMEFLFDQGYSDGLPVVPPTPERVLRMLDGTGRAAEDIVAVVPPNLVEATVEKVAINAVLAGCKPTYLPVVIAALEAACSDDYNAHGVMATTMGASPVLVVNGPIRHELGMNMELGALGQGNRANATIGRALRLILRNVGGARPGGTERSTLGNSGKFTQCFAEWEERHPWAPMHVERGFAREESVVTLFTMSSGPTLMVDQESRTGASLAESFGRCLDAIWHPKLHFGTDVLVVLCPEHVDTLVADGWDKAQLRDRIQAVTARPVDELKRSDTCAVGLTEAQAAGLKKSLPDHRMPKFRSTDDIHIAVAGSNAGKFSGAFHGWATGSIGSKVVSRKIETG